MPESLLSWNEEKKKFEVEITNRKGEKKKIACEDAQLSAELPKTLSEEPLQVEFERNQYGDPIKIRPLGKEWIAPQRKSTRVDYSRKDSASQSGQTKSAKAKDAYPNRRGEEIEAILPEFHNPYNFVPAPERVMQGDLADAAPCGHDRYHPDKYSGKLRVRMRVETPLLLPDAARMSVGDKEHKSFPVRVRPLLDEHGNEVKDARDKTVEIPDINPTAIKGMLRSAYEAVTNSRFAVFQKHNERLAFRMDAREGIYVIPACIERQGDKQHIVLLPGSSIIGTGGAPQLLNSSYELQQNGPRDPMYAAWLGRHTRVNKNLRVHGKKVWAYITRWRHQAPDFLFWSVVEIRPHTESPPTDTNLADDRPEGGKYWKWDTHNHTGEWVEGHICMTMYRNQRNIKNRHDERVFFDKYKDQQTAPELITKDHRAAWKELISNYHEEHDDGKGGLEPAPHEPIKLEWSRHIHQAEFEKELPDNTLCYARAEHTTSGWHVEELIPVMISRRLHEVSPAELLPKELHPAQTLAELSPADRVFGWVRQANENTHKELTKEDKKLGAYRGQIRLGVVELAQPNLTDNGIENFAADNLPLQILGQPKPQQGRFYVARDKDGNAQQKVLKHESGITNEAAGYNEPARKGLRGRKVYPHHNLPDAIKDEYWQDPLSAKLKTSLTNYFREYRRPQNDGKERDNQNRSIEGWVKKGVEFEFDLHFTNLSEVELGALIWLLDLNKYAGAADQDKRFFHRFGGGKPLGFGSVHLSLTNTEIYKGSELKRRYETLEKVALQFEEAQDCVRKFKEAIESAYDEPYDQVAFIKGFLKSAVGFEKPTHYPRITKDPNPDGKSFEWFVKNNGRFGYKLALPDIDKDEGLPLNPGN